MEWWLWLVLGFALLLVEVSTPGGFYLFFFGLASIAVAVVAFSGLVEPLWLQGLLFAVLSVVALFFLRKPMQERFGRALTGPPVDSLVGETAVALKDIAAGDIGQAELRGTNWNAKNVGAAALAQGQRCRVEQIDGLMLLVRAES